MMSEEEAKQLAKAKVDQVIKGIDKKMRSLDRKSAKCIKTGDVMWSTVYTGRILGLLDARAMLLEEFKQ